MWLVYLRDEPGEKSEETIFREEIGRPSMVIFKQTAKRSIAIRRTSGCESLVPTMSYNHETQRVHTDSAAVGLLQSWCKSHKYSGELPSCLVDQDVVAVVSWRGYLFAASDVTRPLHNKPNTVITRFANSLLKRDRQVHGKILYAWNFFDWGWLAGWQNVSIFDLASERGEGEFWWFPRGIPARIWTSHVVHSLFSYHQWYLILLWDPNHFTQWSKQLRGICKSGLALDSRFKILPFCNLL
jgi:hypothetical protein